jgi:hypothetical protein
LGVLAGAENATSCAIYSLKRSFYQDRLGTNIGKVEKRVAFFVGRRHRPGLLRRYRPELSHC